MTVSTLGQGEVQHRQTYQSIETLTQSTATTNQTISVTHDITVLGMGTATGFGLNRYLLSTSGAVEGMEKTIISNATGEAKVLINNVGPTLGGTFPLHVAGALLLAATTVDALQAIATATGCLVFGAADDTVVCRFRAGWWRVVELYGATLATTT